MEVCEVFEFDLVAERVAGGGNVVVSRIGRHGDAAVAGEEVGAGLGPAGLLRWERAAREAESDVYCEGASDEVGEMEVELHV